MYSRCKFTVSFLQDQYLVNLLAVSKQTGNNVFVVCKCILFISHNNWIIKVPRVRQIHTGIIPFIAVPYLQEMQS